MNEDDEKQQQKKQQWKRVNECDRIRRDRNGMIGDSIFVLS